MTIKSDILELSKKYYRENKSTKFVPGQTYIPAAKAYYDEKEVMALVSASLDMKWVDGDIVHQFEREMARYMGVRFAIMTNSGSSANLLAISALTSNLFQSKRLQPGDEVITVAAGFPTTVNPIIQNNLIPVFVDTNIGTYNTTPYLVDQAITDKTRAIFIAHTLGNPYDIDEIKEIAKLHNLWVLEDCCDCIGAEFDGRKVGTFGNVSTASFYPAHLMAVGEGGMVFTDSGMIDKAVRSFRDWGRQCFPAGTLINTGRTQTPIEKVKAGDFVLSHTGNFQEVTETIHRKYSGNIYKIKPRNAQEIICTENHPFFIKRDGEYVWANANELKKSDFVLERLLPSPDSNLEIGEELGYTYTTLYKEESVRLPIDGHLLRLSGYWLAEGSLSSGKKGKSGYKGNDYYFYRVDFSFHKKEVDYISDVCNLMSEIFGVSGNLRQKNGNGVSLSFKSRKAYEYFSQFFGTGAPNKSMPVWMELLPNPLINQLIIGYWRGDGSSSTQQYHFGSTSPHLLNQVRRILARNDILSSYYLRLPEQHISSMVNGKQVKAKHTLYQINIYGGSSVRLSQLLGENEYKLSGENNYSYVLDGYIHYPIDKIRIEKVKGLTVYNLEVENDHSYHANNLAVHNCWCSPGKDNTCGKRFGWCGQGDLPDNYDHKYIYSHIGYNLKSTDLQAAIGLEQLKKLPEFLEDRKENWEYIREQFKAKGLDKYFILPTQLQKAKPAWFGFILTIRDGMKFTRNELVQYLEEKRIGSRNLFGGNLTKQPAYIGGNWRISDTVSGLPHTDIVMSRTFWIGCHPSLTQRMIDYMVQTFKDFIDEHNSNL